MQNILFYDLIPDGEFDKEAQKFYIDRDKFLKNVRQRFPDVFENIPDYKIIDLVKNSNPEIGQHLEFIIPLEKQVEEAGISKGYEKPKPGIMTKETSVTGGWGDAFIERSIGLLAKWIASIPIQAKTFGESYGRAKEQQYLMEKIVESKIFGEKDEEFAKKNKEFLHESLEASKKAFDDVPVTIEYLSKHLPGYTEVLKFIEESDRKLSQYNERLDKGFIASIKKGRVSDAIESLGYQTVINAPFTLMAAVGSLISSGALGSSLVIFSTASADQFFSLVSEKKELEKYLEESLGKSTEEIRNIVKHFNDILDGNTELKLSDEEKKAIEKIKWIDEKGLANAYGHGLIESLTELLGTFSNVKALKAAFKNIEKTVGKEAAKEVVKQGFRQSAKSAIRKLSKEIFLNSEGFEELAAEVSGILFDYFGEMPETNWEDVFDIERMIDVYASGMAMGLGYSSPIEMASSIRKRRIKRRMSKLMDEIKKVEEKPAEETKVEETVETNIPESLRDLSKSGKTIDVGGQQILSFIQKSDKDSIINGFKELDEANKKIFVNKLGRVLSSIEFFVDENGEKITDEDGNILNLKGKLQDDEGNFDPRKVLAAALYISGHSSTIESLDEKSLRFYNIEDIASLFESPEDFISDEAWLDMFPDLVPEDVSKPEVEFVLHSGAAPGADQEWDKQGRNFGVKVKHYFIKRSPIPGANVPISDQLAQEADEKLNRANLTLQRKFPMGKQKADDMLRRSWFQVKNADAVFAVGNIIKPGEKNSRGYINKSKTEVVDGGTGWAVQMAIDEGKPVYVFDQKTESWYEWKDGKFEKTDTPYLTPNFAGIGSRNLTEAGKKAISDVYAKTFKVKEVGKAEAEQTEEKPKEEKKQETTKKTMITNEDEEKLRELGYTPADYMEMAPEEAQHIIENNIRKEVKEKNTKEKKQAKEERVEEKEEEISSDVSLKELNGQYVEYKGKLVYVEVDQETGRVQLIDENEIVADFSSIDADKNISDLGIEALKPYDTDLRIKNDVSGSVYIGGIKYEYEIKSDGRVLLNGRIEARSDLAEYIKLQSKLYELEENDKYEIIEELEKEISKHKSTSKKINKIINFVFKNKYVNEALANGNNISRALRVLEIAENKIKNEKDSKSKKDALEFLNELREQIEGIKNEKYTPERKVSKVFTESSKQKSETEDDKAIREIGKEIANNTFIINSVLTHSNVEDALDELVGYAELVLEYGDSKARNELLNDINDLILELTEEELSLSDFVEYKPKSKKEAKKKEQQPKKEEKKKQKPKKKAKATEAKKEKKVEIEEKSKKEVGIKERKETQQAEKPKSVEKEEKKADVGEVQTKVIIGGVEFDATISEEDLAKASEQLPEPDVGIETPEPEVPDESLGIAENDASIDVQSEKEVGEATGGDTDGRDSKEEKDDIEGSAGEALQEVKEGERNEGLIDKIVRKLKETYPKIQLEALDAVFDKYGREVAGKAFGKVAQWSKSKGTIDTAPHEVFHIVLEAIKNDPVVKLGIKKFGSIENLVEQVGLYYANRIQQKGLYNKVRIWLKQFWLKVKKIFGRLDNNDIVQLLGERFYKGEFNSKVEEYIDKLENKEFEETDDRFQENLQEIKYDNEFESNPYYIGDKLFNRILDVYIPNEVFAKLIDLARNSFDEDYQVGFKKYLDKKVKWFKENTNYRIVITDKEVIVKYKGFVKKKISKEKFIREELSFYNAAINSIPVYQLKNKEHNLPSINVAKGRIEYYGILVGDKIKLFFKNHIAPNGRMFNRSSPMNFLHFDWLKGRTRTRIIYFSTKDVYKYVESKGKEFVIKFKNPDFEVSASTIKDWQRSLSRQYDKRPNKKEKLYFFIGEVGGDNSHLFFGTVPREFMEYDTLDKFEEYLRSELNNGLLYRDVANQLYKYAREELENGNVHIIPQLIARHEFFKDVKGKNYAIRYKKAGMAKFWKYFKLDNGKGVMSPNPAKFIIMDHNELVIKYNGKEVNLRTELGGYTFDGWQIVSPKWMADTTRKLGQEAAVMKPIIRYNSEFGYIAEKVGSYTAFPGMEFYRKTDKGLELVAKVEGGGRDAKLITVEGIEIDHIVTQEEVKDASGEYAEFWKVHEVPREGIRILFYPEKSTNGAAHPILAYELGLNSDVLKSQEYKDFILSVERFFKERVEQIAEYVSSLLNDPNSLAKAVANETNPTLEIDLAAEVNPKLLYLPHFLHQWQNQFKNFFVDKVLRLRSTEGTSTKLFIKPDMAMAKEGECAISGENKTVFKYLAKLYGKKVPYNSDGIDLLNAWLDRNDVYILLARNPIQDHTKVQPFKVTRLVKGFHGDTIFLHPNDVYGIHEGDHDIDSLVAEFLPDYLTKAWLKWKNTKEFKNWYKQIYDVFKSKAETTSPIDPYALDEYIENNGFSRNAQGSVVNGKTLFHVLSWKNVKIKLKNGKVIVPYNPMDTVVLDYWELDDSKVEKLKDFIKRNGDEIVEIDGKKYIKTHKTTEFSYILQMAVDDIKFRLLKELKNKYNISSINDFILTRIFKYEDGSAINPSDQKVMRSIRGVYSFFNHSSIFHGRDSNGRKLSSSEFASELENIYSIYYVDGKLKDDKVFSKDVTRHVRANTSSFYSDSFIDSITLENKLTFRELLLTELANLGNKVNVFFNYDSDDALRFHQIAFKKLLNKYKDTFLKMSESERQKIIDLIDKLSQRLKEANDEYYANVGRDDIFGEKEDEVYIEYKVNKMYEDVMEEFHEQFENLTPLERKYATFYWLSGAKYKEGNKIRKRKRVKQLMPFRFSDKEIMSMYAEEYWKAAKESNILDFNYTKEEQSTLSKIMKITIPEYVRNGKVC